MDIEHGTRLCEVRASVELAPRPRGLLIGDDEEVSIYRACRDLRVVAVTEHIVCWVDTEGTYGTTLRSALDVPKVDCFGHMACATVVCLSEVSIAAGFKVVRAAIEECERQAELWKRTAEAASKRKHDV